MNEPKGKRGDPSRGLPLTMMSLTTLAHDVGCGPGVCATVSDIMVSEPQCKPSQGAAVHIARPRLVPMTMRYCCTHNEILLHTH